MTDIAVETETLVVEAQDVSTVLSEIEAAIEVVVDEDVAVVTPEEMTNVVIVEEVAMTLEVVDNPQIDIVEVIAQGPAGPRGVPGSQASLSTDPGQLATMGQDEGIYVGEQAVKAVAAVQDTLVVFDFDYLVSATLGV